MADDCALAMLRLREQLSSRWPDRMFFSGAENMSILSLSTGLTVWGLRGAFMWNEGGRVVRYPLHDVNRAAEHLLVRAGLLRGLGWPSGEVPRTAEIDTEDDAGNTAERPDAIPELPGQLALLPQPAKAAGGSYSSARFVGTSGQVSTIRLHGAGPSPEAELSQAAS